jgi:hypothetical protein
MTVDLIYTRTDKWILSKTTVDWRIWQDKFYHYMTSLSFSELSVLVDFLEEDFNLSKKNKNEILNYVSNSKREYFELTLNDIKITLNEIQLDLLHSKGEIIDWKDWSYFFTKTEKNEYHLWVYVGGIADLVREIKLDDKQINKWKEIGNDYIKEMASELQQKNSKIYENAINDNRKII